MESELSRRLANVIRAGVVAHVDGAAARVRVRSGELLTDWLPWLVQRAGDVVTWCAPSVGEQCLLLAPGGDLAAAVVLPGIYSTAVPAPAQDVQVALVRFPDGTVLRHDFAARELLIDVAAGGSLTLRCGPSSLVLDAEGARITAPRIDLN
ncbi:phage baseplate assembly protein V [Rubrivivax gelatinosus]|uniref:Phage baseplate assembly protein V n=1 Tax=Rubrivivax gelatinosus TaxID=28068 RepID=A0A4R2MLJ2_RUBGE|nr:phage baseplate assembly protein V [Rubrivivax gelatinosus]MBK1686199.1 hypothetical protein [Rubrivivax gelatinosus]TCP05694.1 phage baseplate assembly protein V [Rubrivivax gelatinosus]